MGRSSGDRMAVKDKKNGVTIIIKKEEVVEGGHHGGAWKVAYADFVTAMMAFFLLMWLLNATTEEQRRGLADYFSPMNVMSRNTSGSGQPFGGHTPYDDGTLVSDRGAAPVMAGKAPPPPDEDTDSDQMNVGKTPSPTSGQAAAGGRAGKTAAAHGNATTQTEQQGEHAPGGGVAPSQAQTASKSEFLANAGAGTQKPDLKSIEDAALKAEAERRERAEFEKAAQQIREAVRADPALVDLGRQLAIDITPEGLRIQLLDEDKQPMFASGSATLSDKARLLLQMVAPVLAKLPEPLLLTGHTDATPYNGVGRSNWELSSDRANATRRVLVEAGLPEERFKEVAGRADRDPLLPAEPMAAANRRIAIIVQHSFRAP
jgi:chemotaxis protein MotB